MTKISHLFLKINVYIVSICIRAQQSTGELPTKELTHYLLYLYKHDLIIDYNICDEYVNSGD